MNNSNANNASKPAPLFKTIAISALLALLLGLVGYVVGVRQEREKLAQQETKYATELRDVNSKLDRKSSELKTSRDLEKLMQARAALYRSAIDLDKRNFGTANTHLKEAAQSLKEIRGTNSALSTAEMTRLQNAISKTSINVAVNLEDQRAQVLEFARQLNELMP